MGTPVSTTKIKSWGYEDMRSEHFYQVDASPLSLLMSSPTDVKVDEGHREELADVLH